MIFTALAAAVLSPQSGAGLVPLKRCAALPCASECCLANVTANFLPAGLVTRALRGRAAAAAANRTLRVALFGNSVAMTSQYLSSRMLAAELEVGLRSA